MSTATEVEFNALSRIGDRTTVTATVDGKTVHRDAVILDVAADRRRFARVVVRLLNVPAEDRKDEVRRIGAALVKLADVPAPFAEGMGPRPGNGSGGGKPTCELEVRCAADTPPEETSWLWPGRIPFGVPSLLCAHPGVGKSFLTCEMAARLTAGGWWPDGGHIDKGDVLMMNGEDHPARTIVPRLLAAGADMKRVHLVGAVKLTEADGSEKSIAFDLLNFELLRKALDQLPNVQLVIVDPVGAYLGGGTDAHRDNEVRAIMHPLVQAASERDIAVLIVAHTRKASVSRADDSVLGSRAFTGLVRSVLHLSLDETDRERRLLLPGKVIDGKPADGLAFRIEGEPAAIKWEDGTLGAMHADDVLTPGGSAPRGPAPAKRTAAADWLVDLLANGPVPVDDIKSAAADAGMAWGTVRRAQGELRITPRKAGFAGGWTWSLPGDQPTAEPARAPKPSGPWSDEGYALRNGMFSLGEHDAGSDGGLPD